MNRLSVFPTVLMYCTHYFAAELQMGVFTTLILNLLWAGAAQSV